MLRKLVRDLRGIRRVCGPAVAARWLGCVLLTLPKALRTRDLLAADAMMGAGPFRVLKGSCSAILQGENVFSGIREIWVRDVYSRGGFLVIPDNATVVDLGSNLGNFSMMALAANRSARVIAVEPGRHYLPSIETARRNGFGDRFQLCSAFVGDLTALQENISIEDPNYRGVPVMAEQEFLARYEIGTIDFLKCDIEGSEYFLLGPDSVILDRTSRVAVELHDSGGRPRAFLSALERKGFDICSVEWSGTTAVALAERSQTAPIAASPASPATLSHDVAVIGLGYVGLTLATGFADVGYRVLGVEMRADVVKSLSEGEAHFSENGLQEILSGVLADRRMEVRREFQPTDCCDTYVITVGTPLGPNGQARLDMIESAARQVSECMPAGALVILRSTVKVGTARNVVLPILRASGKRFDLAMCPERTVEGMAMEELRRLPQIVGADDLQTRERASRLFSRLTSQIIPVSSLEAAEVIKLVDNTYRDVQFAFANEIARLCDAIGISAKEVISMGKLGYARTNIALPGLVGGPCLEKDPHILRESAREHGIDMEITAASRLVNERQPRESAAFIAKELARRGIGAAPRIAILGMAFKGVPQTDDLRGSMALHVVQALKELLPDAQLGLFDPVVSEAALNGLGLGAEVHPDVSGAIDGASVAVITNNHPMFATLGYSTLTRALVPGGFVYDFWNHYNEAGPAYFAVGNLRSSVR